MRRPHVYERSAPRGPRGPYQEPVADPGAAYRDMAASLAGLVSRAEASGLPVLADLIRAALHEARRAAAADRSAASDTILVETQAPVAAEVEGVMRVRNMSNVLTAPKA